MIFDRNNNLKDSNSTEQLADVKKEELKINTINSFLIIK